MTNNLKGAYAAGISLSLLSVMMFAGISGMSKNTAFAAYGGSMGDGGAMMDSISRSANSTSHFVAGSIANVQLNSDGSPGWIQSGIWVMRASFDQGSDEPKSLWLMARFAMVMPDGNARHVHTIYGFKPTEFTTEQNSTIHVAKGTATVTMRDGPVTDVPLTIKVYSGSVIAFWIGPDKVDNHFGSEPLYGILSERSRSAMMQMESMRGG